MRGLALAIMIQVHVFNSFARMDVRNSGVYGLAVFIGGMAGPLFLFMAGMTFAFQMDRLERKEVVGRPALGGMLAPRGIRLGYRLSHTAHRLGGELAAWWMGGDHARRHPQ